MKQSHRIGVYFSHPGENDYPFTKDEYRNAYREFAGRLKNMGADVFIVRGKNTYLGESRFSGGWSFADGRFLRTECAIDVDVIFDKGDGDFAPEDGAVVINNPEMQRAGRKDVTAQMFREFLPTTFTVNSPAELDTAIQSIRSTMIVMKPIDGYGGHGVRIGRVNEVCRDPQMFPFIVQEFIDTSGGIPGVIGGHHDFRIILVGSSIPCAVVRTPPPGRLTANVEMGGSYASVAPERIPEGALRIARAIDARFASIEDRVYSVDVGLDAGGQWKLIEINPPPALFQARGDANMERYHQMLAEHLITSCIRSRNAKISAAAVA
jgi:glutathione synthase/RimK-type ligase-like ATP-grasp enzyme